MLHKISSDWHARIWIEGVGDAERRLEITPAIAGWQSLSFRTYTFRAGQVIDGESATDEMCMVLLAGSITMEAAGQTWVCDGRASVFEGRPHVIYLPPGHTYRMTVHRDADCAYGRAPANGTLPARLITPEDVTIETRGEQNLTHQVTRILGPGDAENLLCTEIIIPPRNWSTFPPDRPDPDRLADDVSSEAVAYYRMNPADGWALQRLSIPDQGPDVVIIAEHGDAMLIRRGSPPVVASPGSEVYALDFRVGYPPSVKDHSVVAQPHNDCPPGTGAKTVAPRKPATVDSLHSINHLVV